MLGGFGVKLGKAEDEGGGSGKELGDGSEGEVLRDSWVVFRLGWGLGPGLGSVCSGDKVFGLVSGVWYMGEAVGVLWA